MNIQKSILFCRISLMVLLVISMISLYCKEKNKKKYFIPFAPDVLIVGNIGMVPIRPVAELYGVYLKVKNNTVSMIDGDNCIKFTTNSNFVSYNSKLIHLPQSPFEHAGVKYVPLRVLINLLGGSIEYDRLHKTVSIYLLDKKKMICSMYQQVNPEKYLDDNDEVYIIDITGKGLRRLTFNNSVNGPITFFNSGNTILYERDNSIIVRDVNDLSETKIVVSSDGCDYRHACINHKNNTIAYTEISEDGCNIILYDLINKKINKLTKGYHPCFSPDSETIAYNDDDKIYTINMISKNKRVLCDGDFPIMFNTIGTVLLSKVSSPDKSQLISCIMKNDDINVYKSVELNKYDGSYGSSFFNEKGDMIIFYRYGDNEGIFISNSELSKLNKLKNIVISSLFYKDEDNIVIARQEKYLNTFYNIDIKRNIITKMFDLNMRVKTFMLTPDYKKILFYSQPENTPDSE